MTFKLSSGSLTKLKGVHPDLVRVVKRAITLTPVDFRVTQGLRSQAEQVILVRAGKSRTMKSRHLTGHAVDVAALVGGQVNWEMRHYREIAKAFKAAAKAENVPIEWGGDWKSFIDGPHFQLPWKNYPA